MSDILDTRFEGKEVEINANLVKAGDDINIMVKDPTLRRVHIGVGWDLNAFDTDAMDLDVSVFLLGKDGKTRFDEDFVFYNNMQTLNGGVKHSGDSRTGAGDGDDESIIIDLQSIPFEIAKIACILSIYRGDEKGQGLGQLQNVYVRLVNADSAVEILRFDLTSSIEDKKETAMLTGSINREGPKWHFTPLAEIVDGGLAAAATKYGCIVTQS